MYISEEHKPLMTELASRSELLSDLVIMAGNLCDQEATVGKMKRQALSSLQRETCNYAKERNKKVMEALFASEQVSNNVLFKGVNVVMGTLNNPNGKFSLIFAKAELLGEKITSVRLNDISESLSSTMASLDAVAQMYKSLLIVKDPTTGAWDCYHPRSFNCTAQLFAKLQFSGTCSMQGDEVSLDTDVLRTKLQGLPVDLAVFGR